MTKKPFIIIPALIILHSVVLSLVSVYSGPSRYALRGFSAVWPHLLTLLFAIFLAKKLKAKNWSISVIALALAGIPRALIATIPAETLVLVAITLLLDLISAAALFLAYRYDAFDFSLWEKGPRASKNSYLWKLIVLLVIIAGIFLYYGKP